MKINLFFVDDDIMRILLTGGTGFLGKALCAELLKQQHQLTIFTRQPEKVTKQYQGKVQAISKFEQLNLNSQFDVVINLAGEGIADKPWTNKRKQALYDSRVSLTKDLVNWLKQCSHQPQLLISGSAIGWYGNQNDNSVDENSAPHQEFVHDLCHAWEQAALVMQSSSTRVCIIRTGVVLAAQGGMLKRLLPVFKLNLGGRLGNGQQWFSWIGLDDFIAAILFLIHHPQVDGIFNLTAPNPVTNQQFTQIFAQHLHRIAPFPVPRIFLKLLLGEMSTLLLDGQQVIPQRLINLDFDFKSPTLDQALLNNA